MNRSTISTLAAIGFGLAATHTTAQAKALDPTIGLEPLFGLGGHSCQQMDDTGRLIIRSDGPTPLDVVLWEHDSDYGRAANVPVPDDLARALPYMKPCLPGRHHS